MTISLAEALEQLFPPGLDGRGIIVPKEATMVSAARATLLRFTPKSLSEPPDLNQIAERVLYAWRAGEIGDVQPRDLRLRPTTPPHELGQPRRSANAARRSWRA